MNDIAAFMVVKNDEYYIDMAIKSVLPHVKGIYIQDQMSTDGTYEKIMEMVRESPKIICERVETGHNGRFEQDYNEPHYRAEAVKKAEQWFSPEWILKLDADELYSEYFFRKLAEILPDAEFNGVRVAGDRFISRTHRAIHPSAIEKSPGGVAFVDPHTQVWRANKGYTYIRNPRMSGYFHPVLYPAPVPVYWLEGICNIHLHRTFGSKSLAFWAEGGDKPMAGPPYHPPSMCPKWYFSPVNMGCSEEVQYEWPSFVIDKWREWGEW